MLGDGIRRNIATVSKEERDRFRDAILKMNDGSLTYSDGRTYFQKQEWIHWAGHNLAHTGVAFMGWHRELCNRFEAMLRAIDPQLSLHYWDWTTDPRDQVDTDGNHFSLFSPDFMGDDGSGGIWTAGSEGSGTNPDWGGEAGPPFQNFGTIVNGQTYPEVGGAATGDLADLPSHKLLWRGVGPQPGLTGSSFGGPVVKPGASPGAPRMGTLADAQGATAVAPDSVLITAADALSHAQQFNGAASSFMKGLGAHNYIHQYISGTMGTEHVSLGDPFFFLIHANLDRIWAMWQRALVAGVPQTWRLDPNQTYGSSNGSLNDSYPPWDGTQGPLLAHPLIPWVSGNTADNGANDGVIDSVGGLIPNHAIVSKTAKDPTIVIPHSYDTAVHSSYFIVNRDTFSNSEVTAMGSPAVFPNAFSVVYDGFAPAELGATSTPLPNPPPTLPTFSFTGASNITAVNPSASYESPSGTIDMPQRIVISYDLRFANSNDFPGTAGAENFVNMQASLSYDVDTGTGGSTVNLVERAATELALVNQPNPYMVDTEQGDPSPHWLSVDTRVFQTTLGGVIGTGPTGPNGPATQGDMDTDSNAPFEFIQQVVKNFNNQPNNNSHPFLTQLTEDESGSQLELSQKVGGQRVYNYAIAKVRYLAPSGVDATNVGVFFRVFSTAVSGLGYDATSGSTGNYRRTGNTNASSVPLLGIENDSQGQPETACIPFFASARVDTSTVAMTTQLPDTTNIQTIAGTGAENVAYFGAWLDINLAPGDPHFRQFPLGPSGVTGWPNGPFSGSLSSIQQLMLGTHHCMVAEIFFWPPSVVSDPIPHNATPASSDRLAQRNLVLVESGNPGYPATHTVQHTFIVKPPVAPATTRAGIGRTDQVAALRMDTGTSKRAKHSEENLAAAIVTPRDIGPDELMIRWNNVPRQSQATLYFPEIDVREILALSALRQHPTVLERVDEHTLRCRLSDVTFIPLPERKGTLAGLLSVTLPDGIRTGQVYKFSVEQYSPTVLPRIKRSFPRKTQGAFQMTIPVRPDPEILPKEIRKLAVMKYIQQAIPASSRWYSIFVRYIDQIEARVRGFGGDPHTVKPAPDGGEGTSPVCPPPKHTEVSPADLFCLNIPWKECDIEGELDLKLRFRRKSK